ncbi:MAG: ABC transporter substrate-binding protein [Opitutaceae bacterium]|nr:ABC transporter substrate-binding protein [Opitutaceae bacterium]
MFSLFRRFVTVFLPLSLLLLGGSGCSPKELSSKRPETLIFARGSDAQKLDPADVDDGESVNTISQICEGLVRFKSGTLEIEPSLAESYEISENGLRYTFHLREGVRFHDGTALTAEAALFSFHRQMDESHPGHLPEANFQYWNYLYQEIKEVRAEGEMTVVFELSEPNSSLLYSLAIFPAFLVSPNALETYGEEFQRHPVGTGPYRFLNWTPNQAIVMEKNPDYWDVANAPKFERLVMKVVPENSVRLLELKSGHVHGIDGLQPAELAALESDPRFTVYQRPGMNVGYLTYNLQDPRFTSREVRLAIAMAIDRKGLAKIALDGTGRAADYPIPPGFLGEPKKGNPIPYDPERAREILAAHPDILAAPIKLQVMSQPRQYFPDPVKAASFIRSELEKVGLTVTIEAKDFKSHLNSLRNFEFELGLIGWMGDNGDTDNFLSIFFGSWATIKGAASNYAFYKNDEMDAYLLGARRETDMAKRQELYEKCLALWRRDLPIVPLVHSNNIVVTRSELTGFELQLIGDLRLGPVGWKAE